MERHLLKSPTPPETLRNLATEGVKEARFRQPALLVGIGCDADGELPEELTATEMYLLAITEFLTSAPGVRNYYQLAFELQRVGVDKSESLRSVYGGEFDDLPTHYGSDDFKALWAQIAGPLTSRKGWLNKVDLNTFLDMVTRVDPLISDGAARAGLVDLEMVFRTAIARGHDVLVFADP